MRTKKNRREEERIKITRIEDIRTEHSQDLHLVGITRTKFEDKNNMILLTEK